MEDGKEAIVVVHAKSVKECNQDVDMEEIMDKNEESGIDIDNSLTEEESNNIRFYPPVYLQRYVRVREELKKRIEETEDSSSPKMIMEVGAAELGMHVHLKNLHDSVQKIVFMDIDSDLLERNKPKIKPLTCEYLVKRETPLTVQIYSGCVTKTDSRLLKSDPPLYAIIGIEILEHLDEAIELKFISNIFGRYAPPVIILTTPNGDFNQYLGLAPGKFRHWDHRFELTRLEFTKWCQRVVEYYPKYAFYIKGIGEGPEDSRDFGCVSQMAVFYLKNKKFIKEENNTQEHGIISGKPFSLHPVYRVDQNRNGPPVLNGIGSSTRESPETASKPSCIDLKTNSSEDSKNNDSEPYKLIDSIEYPWAVKPPVSDQVKNNVRYYINQYVLAFSQLEEFWEKGEIATKLTFEQLFGIVSIDLKKTADKLTYDNLKTWLEEDGHQLYGEPEAEGIIVQIPSYESYYDHSSSESSEDDINEDESLCQMTFKNEECPSTAEEEWD